MHVVYHSTLKFNTMVDYLSIYLIKNQKTKNSDILWTIYITDAGKGNVDVSILDPHGRKDTIRPSITTVPGKEGVYLVEYIPAEHGLHSINIMFAGQAIPKSPYGVSVSAGM